MTAEFDYGSYALATSSTSRLPFFDRKRWRFTQNTSSSTPTPNNHRCWPPFHSCNYKVIRKKQQQFNVPTFVLKVLCVTFVLLQLFSLLFTFLLNNISSSSSGTAGNFFHVKPNNDYYCRGGHQQHISFIRFAHAVQIPFRYHNYARLTGTLQQLNSEYASLTRLYSIGKSEQGRELWVLVVSKFPNDRPLLMPAVKYVGNMHGNEAVSREIVLHFANFLLENYGKNPEITKLLDTTQIHLMPSMNPDGFEAAREGECTGVLGRYNARLIDLNRNFPDSKRENPGPRAVEVLEVMRWLDSDHFVLSANLHGGALVASYPYDNYEGFSRRPGYSLSPDDDLFRHLALTYSLNHKRMHFGRSCGETFNNGITNGAGWFPLTGGMQDYNYEHSGTLEITLEVSCCKYPLRKYLRGYYEENEFAMLSFLQEVHKGVKGMVYDAESNQPIIRAVVKIVGRDINFPTTVRGEYFRIIVPGVYQLAVFAEGYLDSVKTVEVLPTSSGAVITNIYLSRVGRAFDPQQQQQRPPALPSPPPSPQPEFLLEKSLLPNSNDAPSSDISNGTSMDDNTDQLMPAAVPKARTALFPTSTTIAPSLSTAITSISTITNTAQRPIEFNERARQLISDSVRKIIFNSTDGLKVQQLATPEEEFHTLVRSGSKYYQPAAIQSSSSAANGGRHLTQEPNLIHIIQLTNTDVVAPARDQQALASDRHKTTDEHNFTSAKDRTAAMEAHQHAADLIGNNAQRLRPPSPNSVEMEANAEPNTTTSTTAKPITITATSTTTAATITTASSRSWFKNQSRPISTAQPARKPMVVSINEIDQFNAMLASKSSLKEENFANMSKNLIAFSFTLPTTTTASPKFDATSFQRKSKGAHFNVQSINDRFDKNSSFFTTTIMPITTTTEDQIFNSGDVTTGASTTKNRKFIVIKAQNQTATTSPTLAAPETFGRRRGLTITFHANKTRVNSVLVEDADAAVPHTSVENKLAARDSAVPEMSSNQTSIDNKEKFNKSFSKKIFRLTNSPAATAAANNRIASVWLILTMHLFYIIFFNCGQF